MTHDGADVAASVDGTVAVDDCCQHDDDDDDDWMWMSPMLSSFRRNSAIGCAVCERDTMQPRCVEQSCGSVADVVGGDGGIVTADVGGKTVGNEQDFDDGTYVLA